MARSCRWGARKVALSRIDHRVRPTSRYSMRIRCRWLRPLRYPARRNLWPRTPRAPCTSISRRIRASLPLSTRSRWPSRPLGLYPAARIPPRTDHGRVHLCARCRCDRGLCYVRSFGSGSVLDGQQGWAGDIGCVLNRICPAKIHQISWPPNISLDRLEACSGRRHGSIRVVP